MQWFYNLKISKKLMLSFLLLAIIAGILGYVGIKEIRSIQMADTKLYEENTEPFVPINNVAVAFQMRRVQLKDMLLKDDLAQRQENVDRIAELDEGVSDSMLELKEHVRSAKMRKEYTDLQDALQTYQLIQEEYIRLVMANQVEQAAVVTTGEQGVTASKAVEAALDNFTQTIIKEARQKAHSNTEIADNALLTMAIIILISVAMALLLGWFVARIISRPLQEMMIAADKLALGDINVRVAAETTDEIGTLAKSFTAMIENIREQALVAERIAAGDMAVQVNIRSENDLLGIKLNEMLANIKMVINEMNKMYENQKAGDIEAFIPVEKFNGAYRQMTDRVNQMVQLHVDAILKMLGIIGAYAEGDFTPVLEKMPGKQVIANERMDLIRNNLLNVINEILTLSKSAAAGQLSIRADASRYSGEYARILQGINEILDAIIVPMQDTMAVLDEMAQGNLTTGITSDLAGDYAQMKNALNNSLKALNEVLGQINEAAEQVASGSGQVADSSQALSQASTEQASSVQEITATMTEISSQTKQNALNANRANEMAIAAQENAVQGNQEMQAMLKAMSEINESSTSISKIIKVIDEIAFQTNILALNAAVEAARAGQHGKGFAVVAEEVRNLAARSANAAKETTVMIEGSINKVEMGTKMATETAGALNKIMDGVSNVANLVGEIAAASNEQATAIAQVNQGIAGIAEVTQMNTATSQQSAAASEQLASQAELLKDQVSRFKLARQAASLQTLPGLTPELIRMLEGIAEKSNHPAAPSGQEKTKASGLRPKVKINLDDSDFGKY